MLVMTRKEGEEIVIGDDIVVRIVTVKRSDRSVRVAVQAPRSVPVHRREVYEAIKAGRRAPALKGGVE